MTETPKITAILIIESKKLVGHLKHRNKGKMKSIIFWFKRRHIKGEKHIASMDCAESLRKLDFLENNKVYYGRFLRNKLHERYYYISKIG